MNRDAFVIAMTSLLVHSLCHSAKIASNKAAKSMSLKMLISTTMAKGEATTLDNPQAENLGYSEPQQVLDYIAADTSKDTQLGSLVILDVKKNPKELVISSTTVTEWTGKEPLAIDGYSFRAKLSGELVSGVRAYGKVGEVIQDPMPLDDTTRKRFKSLLDALLRSHPKTKRK